MSSQASRESKMTPYFSEKIKVVSFFAIIFVLYLPDFPDDVAGTMGIPAFVRRCVAGVFSPCAVPMFYAISGYLFFYGVKSVRTVFGKMKKRVKSLLVPFVIAACLYPLQPILKELLLHIPAERNYMELSYQLGILGTLKALFYDCGTSMPWAYHLWFMRDLVIIVALTPCLHFLRQWAGYWSIAIVLALHWLFPPVKFLYALFWFVAGSFVLDKLCELPRKAVLLLFIAFLFTAVCHQVYDSECWKYLGILEISLGVSSLWCLYDVFVPKTFQLAAAPALNLACQFTFFLYLYHEPSFHIVVKGLPLILGCNWLGYTISFLLSPIVFAPIGIAIGFVLRKYLPKVYRVAVGGR